MLKDLVKANRSYRRFHEDVPVDANILRELVDLARLSASARNVQPLKYILAYDPEKNAAIFPNLAWAGDLPDWPGPAEGERPAAYIIILHDTEISQSPGCDHGVALQSIMLGAMEQGFGSCPIGSINRKELREALAISQRYELLLAIALGRPRESVVVDSVKDGSIKYWRDDQDRHHVPKRSLDDIIL